MGGLLREPVGIWSILLKVQPRLSNDKFYVMTDAPSYNPTHYEKSGRSRSILPPESASAHSIVSHLRHGRRWAAPDRLYIYMCNVGAEQGQKRQPVFFFFAIVNLRTGLIFFLLGNLFVPLGSPFSFLFSCSACPLIWQPTAHHTTDTLNCNGGAVTLCMGLRL